jgi:K+-sensing histidine kinase KdpD
MAVATAWIPFRQHASNVDVALVLMVVITGAGVTGRRPAVAAAAIAAAVGFTFFDTNPYDDFAITRPSDIVTAALLVVAGMATGELAVRVIQQRRRSDISTADDMSRVRNAATSLAAGDELVPMIGAVAADLTRLLGLRACDYSAEPIEAGSVWVSRDGRLRRDEEQIGWLAAMSSRRAVSLPVWGQGQVLGHFVLHPGLEPPTASQLLVAVTLSDQVGAALFAQAPPAPADPGPGAHPPPGPGLRVVR